MSFNQIAWNMAAEGNDPVRALTGLLHRFPEHDMSRCQLIASLLFTMWQLAGRTFSPSPPSFMLVNASKEKDAVWQDLTGMLRFQLAPLKPAPSGPQPFDIKNRFRGNPEMSRKTMLAAIATRKKLARKGLPAAVIEAKMKGWLADWLQCKQVVFPATEINHYSKAWDPDFGWVTNSDDHITLLIHGPKSESGLRSDLLDEKSKLHHPAGVCADLNRGTKKITLAGRLARESWDTSFANGLLRGPLPLVFLPHLSPSPVASIQDADLLNAMVLNFTRHHRNDCQPLRADLHGLPMGGDAGVYASLILRSSADLPGDRRFGIQLLLRELQLVVTRLCVWIQAGHQPSAREVEAIHLLALDLYVTALRGIAYGVAALGFHGRGIGLGADRSGAMQILTHLRTGGPCSRRDLQRKLYKLDASERDRLLARLVEAALISPTGKELEAVPLGDYLAGIPGRFKFPSPTLATTPAYMASMKAGEAS